MCLRLHEGPLTLSLIQTAEAHARAKGAVRVTRLDLVVGDAAGISADCLELYFDLYAQGTMCEAAELAIERVTPKLRCDACGRLFVRRPFSFACPKEGCAGQGVPTDIGREFLIRSIRVEGGKVNGNEE